MYLSSLPTCGSEVVDLRKVKLVYEYEERDIEYETRHGYDTKLNLNNCDKITYDSKICFIETDHITTSKRFDVVMKQIDHIQDQ